MNVLGIKIYGEYFFKYKISSLKIFEYTSLLQRSNLSDPVFTILFLYFLYLLRHPLKSKSPHVKILSVSDTFFSLLRRLSMDRKFDLLLCVTPPSSSKEM